MGENVKLEDALGVSLPTTSVFTCSILHSTKVKDESFCADLNTQVKNEDSSVQRPEHQLKFEAPEFAVTTGNDANNYMKLALLKSEELIIKDEIDQRSTDVTGEKSTQFEYFHCSLCSSKFTYKKNLRRHMNIHTGEKPFQCSLCDFRSARRDDVSMHIKTHTGEKSYKCSLCDYKCIRKGHLSSHMKSHTGERPFKCDLCEFKSARRTDLSLHIKIHTGERPYNCSICDYRCIRKSTLSSHMIMHMGKK